VFFLPHATDSELDAKNKMVSHICTFRSITSRKFPLTALFALTRPELPSQKHDKTAPKEICSLLKDCKVAMFWFPLRKQTVTEGEGEATFFLHSTFIHIRHFHENNLDTGFANFHIYLLHTGDGGSNNKTFHIFTNLSTMHAKLITTVFL
jgi:hypothetical protein